MRIVFLGSADFGIPSLDALLREGHAIAGVVTLPPAPSGRGRALAPTSIDRYARGRGLTPVLTPPSLMDPAFVQELAALSADVFVVIAFRILPQSVFTIPRFGTLNVHASLLPGYRGPAPIQRAIEAGETETGVTVFRIDAGIDTGAVLARRPTAIGAEETAPGLSDRLSAMGADLLVRTLAELERGGVEPLPQDPSLATPAPKLRKEDGRIDWRLAAAAVYNRIRAFKPFPGTFTHRDGSSLAIEWGLPAGGSAGTAPGTVCAVTREGFEVACGSGVLKVLQVKPEGRRTMSAADYVRGYRLSPGTVLG